MSRVSLPIAVALMIAGIGSPLAQDVAPPTPIYKDIPEVFRSGLRAGQPREQFIASYMAEFRASARGGLELDRQSIDLRASIIAAGQRASVIGQLMGNDLDGDGRITRDEVARVVESQLVFSAGAIPFAEQRVAQVMAPDSNADGVIDAAELRAAGEAQSERRRLQRSPQQGERLLSLLAQGQDKLRAVDVLKAAEGAFAMVDRDGDTIISQEEWRQFAEATGQRARGAAPTGDDPAPPPPPARGADEEAFLVGVYEGFTKTDKTVHGPKALVAVDRPGRQVTLMLCSYEAVRWSVTLTPGTVVREVRLWGHSQTSEALVNDRPVTAIRMGRSLACPYERKSREFYRLVRSLKDLTGFDRLADFAGSYRAEPTGFILDRISQDPDRMPNNLTAREPSTLPDIRFQAVIKGASGLHDLTGKLVAQGVRGDGYRSVDAPSRNERYTIADDALTVAPITGSGKGRKIPLSLDVPPLSWPSGIAYDSRRNRILLVSFGGEGVLYAYDIGSEKWSTVASMNNRDVSGLFYDEKTDRLWTRHGGMMSIGPDGVADRDVRLDLKSAPGLADLFDGRSGGDLRLAAVRDGKAVLIASGSRGDSQAFRIYLVDLVTGAVDLTGFAD